MSVASFVAAQRTEHGVPHALTCRALDLSESWFYKWRNRGPTPCQQRRAALDAAVQRSFDASGGRYGSPRVLADLREDGWRVKEERRSVDGPPRAGGSTGAEAAPLVDSTGQGGTTGTGPGQTGFHRAGDQSEVVW